MAIVRSSAPGVGPPASGLLGQRCLATSVLGTRVAIEDLRQEFA
jgi:hypothetical protein